MPHIILQTTRLTLRRFTGSDEDAALILSINSQPEVLKYLHEPLLQNLAHAKKILQEVILPQYQHNLGRWAVHLNNTNEFIGWCGLKYRPNRDETDLGYRFLPLHWGQGYATEAAKACLQYAFHTLKLQKVTACAHVENLASLAVLQKTGMQYTGEAVIDECPVKCFVALNPLGVQTATDLPKSLGV